MHKLTSKKVLAATVAGLAVAGGGAAIAASQSESPASSFFDSVAKHLGISSEELEDATKAAAIDQVDKALEEGWITEERADELKSRIESGEAPWLFGPGVFGIRGHGPDAPRPGHPFFFQDKLAPAADYLGLTSAELLEQLREGKSLADVARAEGKSVDGLEQAILDGARSALDDAVTRESLTQEQADAIYERLQSFIGDLVNGKLPRPPGGRLEQPFGGPPGFAPHDGGDDDGSGGGASGARMDWDTAA